MKNLKKIINQREFFIVTVVALIFLTMRVVNPAFLSKANLFAMLLSISGELVIGVGLTLVMISNGFDMSLASNLALSGALAALSAKAGSPLIICVLVGVTTGLAIGCFNGYFISYLGMAPFVVTLASMNIFRGLLVGISQGQSVLNLPESYKSFGQANFLGIQMPIWYAAIIVIIAIICMKYFRFFRQSFYIGSNYKASLLSGINVKRTKFLYFVIVGGLAGLSGVIISARYGTAATSTAMGMELRIITAVIVGGASISGGAGSILGTVFGSVLMASITNIINIVGASIYWQTFITGFTLFLAVLLDQLTGLNKIKLARKETEKLLRMEKRKIS